jgi:shikimate dehydrogenase
VADRIIVPEKRYAVFGDPIAHSLSPRIHAAFARQTGISLSYAAIRAPERTFESQLADFNRNGGAGANITLPLKSVVLPLCAELSDFARRIGAVNTLTRRLDNHWRGDNTDGPGLIRDLTDRHRIDLRGRRALILGAGGAARASAFALLDAGIETLTIANRTLDRATALADALGEPAHVTAIDVTSASDAGHFDLILDATSAGLHGVGFALPTQIVTSGTVCYHLSYGKAAKQFLVWAREAGAKRTFDGLGMLVEQAAESFEIWNGVRPDTLSIYNELRAESIAVATD